MSTLQAARAALRGGDHGAARDALAAVWRTRRSPEIAELVAVLDAHAPDALRAQLATIEAELAVLVEPLRGDRRSADALLAEIYAHPADDAPRLVYADVLSAQGDPRGEFIVLRGDGEPGARELELLKQHGKAWLGDLAPALSWGKGYARTTFRRGFVSKADIILSVGKKLRPILAHPAWATVEEIDGLYRDDDQLLVHAPLRALRMLDVQHAWPPALAARAEKLTAVRRIQIPSWQPADAAQLRAAFPHVETLFVPLGEITRDDIATFTTLGIDHVELRHGNEPSGKAALATLARLAKRLVGEPAPIARLTLLHSMSKTSDRFELRRDATGCYA
jgi:uncharacterized protein (TIGR02996 family)